MVQTAERLKWVDEGNEMLVFTDNICQKTDQGLVKHNSLELDAKITEMPCVTPMVRFRGEGLGWFGDLDRIWRVVARQKPVYDQFPYQYQLFYQRQKGLFGMNQFLRVITSYATATCIRRWLPRHVEVIPRLQNQLTRVAISSFSKLSSPSLTVTDLYSGLNQLKIRGNSTVPLTMTVGTKGSSPASFDASGMEIQNLQLKTKNNFASISAREEKPFDFLRTLFEGVIAGGTSGVVVETALYPIDTIKTRLQAARGGGKIVLKGLYSGLAGNIAGVLPASAVFVGVYEPTKQKLLKALPENLSAVAHLTAGAVGGLAASLIRVPTEVVKQRMQTGQFTSAPNAVRLIISKEGFKGLYAGYGSFLLRDLPFDAIQFCLYEQIRIGYKMAAKRDLNDPENAIIGAFAGALTGAMTTPLDVIKTRLMVQGSANQYKGIIDCVQTIVREEGAPALLKGIGPRVLWIGIGGSIFFGVLERTKKLLEERRPMSDSKSS